ncbi:MAG TPA: (d)CMP kinase [Gemmatimonadales bacterium]|nr:(d)CMP kinase [Gemmatimonadales bacterium]
MAEHPVVIAIDGPAASGKSTTAAAVARELGALHLDSGALYRALTAVALAPRQTSPERLLESAEARGLELREAGGALVPFLDDRDAEPLLRTAAVNEFVSEVSAWPAVRDWVNARLRDAAARGEGRSRPLVLDGRDIGTVVFPHAPVKVFLTATPEARARRRLLQRGADPADAEVAREAARLAERDRRDAARPVAPLRRAADAVLLDTTTLEFAEQVGEIVRLVRRNLPGL